MIQAYMHFMHLCHGIQCMFLDDFSTQDISFNRLPTISKKILEAMLPEQHGEVHKASLRYINIIHIKHIIHIAIHSFVFRTGWQLAGGFLLDRSNAGSCGLIAEQQELRITLLPLPP